MPAIAEVTEPVNGILLVLTNPCAVCGTQHRIQLDANKFVRWINGEHIQNVWPEMSVADREILISGTCSKCFDELFPPEDE